MISTSQKTSHICVTRPGQEEYIGREIALRAPTASCSMLTSQVVSISSVHDGSIFAIPLCFARQILPSPILLEEHSISQWSETIIRHLVKHEQTLVKGWKLHVFSPKSSETGEQYGRARLIEQRIMSTLKAKRRSLLRSLTEDSASAQALVQILCISDDKGFMSVTTEIERNIYGAALSTHRGGYMAIEDNKKPPSRAFKKLEEAIHTFGLSFSSNQTAVDLGASPGGWTYVLQKAGLQITALDRSPLEPSLMKNSAITWVKGNALTWSPPSPVSWLVCDVITTPQNTLSILTSWIINSWCQNFCVTIKCQGTPDFETINETLTFLSKHTAWFDAKQLTHNKNELTVCGILAS